MKTISASLKEYARGVAGGLLFSLPLFYTQEIWEAGLSLPPERLLIYLLVTFVLLLGYNRHAGLHASAKWNEIITDSVEEIGLGLFLSLAMLQALGQLNWQDHSPHDNFSKVIMLTMPVAIGISIGTAQLQADEDEKKRNQIDADGSASRYNETGFSSRFVLAVCGSVVVAGNMAPTEEIREIAVHSTLGSLLTIVLISWIIGIIVLFFSDFKGSHRSPPAGLILTALRHTMTAYLASILASVLMLWFFGQLTDAGLITDIALVIVLGFPAMLGASAGRLLIKGDS